MDINKSPSRPGTSIVQQLAQESRSLIDLLPSYEQTTDEPLSGINSFFTSLKLFSGSSNWSFSRIFTKKTQDEPPEFRLTNGIETDHITFSIICRPNALQCLLCNDEKEYYTMQPFKQHVTNFGHDRIQWQAYQCACGKGNPAMKDYTSFREHCKKDCHILFHHPFDRPSTAFWDVTHGCIRCPTCNKGIVSFDNWQEYYSHGCDNIGKQWLIPTWFWRWMYKIPDAHLWGSVVSASVLYTILGWSIYNSRFGPQHAHPRLVGYEL